MLPHKHFLIAGAVITPFAIIFFPQLPFFIIAKWISLGGILSAAIDLDIYTIALLKSMEKPELRIFRNPLNIYRKFDSFMETILKTGVLKIGMATHLILGAFIFFLTYRFLNSYSIPVLLGILSHILSDMPHLLKTYGNGRKN